MVLIEQRLHKPLTLSRCCGHEKSLSWPQDFYNALKEIFNSMKEINKGKHIPLLVSNTRGIEKGSEA